MKGCAITLMPVKDTMMPRLNKERTFYDAHAIQGHRTQIQSQIIKGANHFLCNIY